MPRNYIFIFAEFTTKLTIFLLQVYGAKLPPNGFVLCQFCGQCGDLCFQLTYHFQRCIQSLLQLGFLALLDIELLCRSCQIFIFRTIQHNFRGKRNCMGFYLLHFLNGKLLCLNILDLLFQRSCMLLFLLRLCCELFQSLLFPFHLELRHSQVFLGAASFSTLHIRISGIAYGLEEIILEDAVRLP